jgi:hypothetical protein
MLSAYASILHAQVQAEAEQPNPDSQPNRGVIADEVRGDVTINNNFARRYDVNRDRVGAMMSRYLHRFAAAQASMSDNIEFFTILQDNRDASFRAVNGGYQIFTLIAGTDDHLEALNLSAAPRCNFQEGHYMAGTVISGSVSDRLNFSQEFLAVDHPLFVQVCDSLGGDARGPGTGRRSSQEVITNFDVLAVGGKPVVLLFLPGEREGVDFETAVARDFWLGAVFPINLFEMGEVAQRELEREYGRTRTVEMAEEASETGRFSASLDLQRLGLTSSADAQRQAAQRDFGPVFVDLEDRWRRTLSEMRPVIRADARTMTASGVLTPRLQRFSISEVGTPAFWSHIEEAGEFQSSIICLGTRFAVEQEYARSRDLPNYADCVAQTIRSVRESRR